MPKWLSALLMQSASGFEDLQMCGIGHRRRESVKTQGSSMSDIVSAAIVQAIRAGAPLYNAGQPQACRQLYKEVAQGLATGAAPHISKALSAAVAASDQEKDPSDGAWVLRRCFDSILDGRLDAEARLSQMAEGASEVVLLDFEAGLPPAPRWFSMDDGIMGGLSSSSMVYDPNARAAVFQGTVTTANNGGFASMRSESWGGYAMQAAKGFRLLVSGDGRTYKLSAKPDDGYDGVMYQHDFATVDDGKWHQVDLAFENFRPNFRGRVVSGRPPLRGGQVRQLGLMLSKFSDAGGLTPGFRPGPFRLAIRSLRGIIL